MTESGSIYRLGEPLTQTDSKKPPRTFRTRISSDENTKVRSRRAIAEGVYLLRMGAQYMHVQLQ